MEILRGVYNSGIIVEIKHDDAERYTEEYRNDLFRSFVSDLLFNTFSDNDYLVNVSWIKGRE